MNKKLFLTSLTAIAIAMPAMAEDFPSTGLMQESKTYTEAANHDNMGVYDGTVTANAEYEWDIITVNPGYYVPANSTTAAQCTTGNYCEGIPENQQARTPHYQSTVQGLSQCPANYSNSAAGSDASTDCYRTCTTADVSHSTAVTGAMYYNGTSGDGVNACEPTSNGCANGYHYKAAVTAPDLTTIIGVTQAGTDSAYIGNSGSGSNNASTYGLSSSDHNVFVVDYGDDKKIKGHGHCSGEYGSFDGDDITIRNSLTDEATEVEGGYCWCRLDGYTLTNSTIQSLSAPWAFLPDDSGYADMCNDYCARYCALWLQWSGSNNLAFRAAVFGSIQSSPAMCEANQITINWTGATAQAIADNNAASTVYGGDVRTPSSAIPVTGKTFKGWRFEKPTTPSQGD